MYPSVAILILNFNGRHYLEQFIPWVLAATYPNKTIWLIDNASTDDSIAFTQSAFPSVNIIINKQNFGFAQGYNEGLLTIDANYFLLLNNDVEPTSGFIEPVITLMESDKTIAFAQPKLIDMHNRNIFEYAGAAGGIIDAVGYPFCRGRILETTEADDGQYNNNSPVFWASGCCLFARSSIYKELNGMYNFLYMQNEDIELCWRAQNEGYKILACGQSTIYHQGGGSLSWDNPKKVFFTFRNNLIMITRNMPVSRLLWVLPLRLLIDMAAAFQYLLKGKAAAGKAVFAGIFAFIKWLFTPAPGKWPSKRGFKNCKGTISKLLVWEYFIRKKKTYSAIISVRENSYVSP